MDAWSGQAAGARPGVQGGRPLAGQVQLAPWPPPAGSRRRRALLLREGTGLGSRD